MTLRKNIAAGCCLAVALLIAQMAGWDYHNLPCLFTLSPGCAASCLNRSAALRNAGLRVQAIGNIKYVGRDEALIEYLVEPVSATAADEASPNSSQIRMAAFNRVFYRWRLEP